MERVRRGFTIVEVSIFLAVTGLLFIGITVGVQNSIFQQRYTDAVQGFADFLRNAYSDVLNVQSLGRGNSDLAIYGKMITFNTRRIDQGSDNEQEIRMYNVVGDADSDCGDGDIIKMLKCVKASVVYRNDPAERNEGYELAGVVEEYRPRWGTRIQKTNNSPQTDFSGVVLIVRSPESGRVYTLISREPIVIDASDNTNNAEQALLRRLEDNINDSSKFHIEQVDFCVNPNGKESSTKRADVRIAKGASNASGIEIIMDSDDNDCRGE